VSDAHELLRRYLEQRRDLGETEFALDGLSVDEALALIGNRGKDVARPAARAPHQAAAERQVREAPVGDGGDWRAALAATGLTPEPKPGDKRFAFAAPEATASADSPKAEPADGPGAPDGLIVGQAGGTDLPPEVASALSLEDIARLVAGCAGCELGASKTRDVVGEGNPNADFVVVGEAPGEQEDLSGRPFVGASGQLLTKILAAIQLSREQVYICNVLKHRPPGNRNPTPAEVAACSPFLLRQLELVKPKVILAVGTFAAQTLLRTKEPIGKLRGRVHRYFGVPLVVTYHPAALLRNPTWKRPTWDDVQLARRILDRASNA
jgi:DNA polymerase